MDKEILEVAKKGKSFMLSSGLLSDEVGKAKDKDLVKLSKIVRKQKQEFFFSDDMEFLKRKRNALNRQIARLKKAEIKNYKEKVEEWVKIKNESPLKHCLNCHKPTDREELEKCGLCNDCAEAN